MAISEDVRVVEYQDTWPAQFVRVSAEIRSAVLAPGSALEHVGSTAVPGLCAKPVLDVLLGLPSLAEAEACIPTLVAIGFVYRPEYEAKIPDRRYFVRPAGETPRVHLHAVVLGSTLWQQHLHFRDQLRQDSRLMQSYASLKRELASIHASDKVAYTEAKAPFIRQVLASLRTRTTCAHSGAA